MTSKILHKNNRKITSIEKTNKNYDDKPHE